MTTPTRDGSAWKESDPWQTKHLREAIKVLCRRVLDLKPEEECTVEFFASPTRKLYLIVIPSRQQLLLFRACPPDDEPYRRTMSDVATLEWVHEHTTIPVPHIVAFDASPDNEVGFEWVLTPHIAGSTAMDEWDDMSMAAKEKFTRQVAEFACQLVSASERLHLRGTGKIASILDKPGGDIDLGMPFPTPLPSFREWLLSEIRRMMLDAGSAFLRTQDTQLDSIKEHLVMLEALIDRVRTVFPATDQPEPTALQHLYLHLDNILVDDEGAITAVLGWDAAMALPTWSAGMPDFLQGPERQAEPDPDSYGHVLMAKADALEMFGDWDDLMEYEQTQLRKVYTEHMRHLRPTWDVETADGALKREVMKEFSKLDDLCSVYRALDEELDATHAVSPLSTTELQETKEEDCSCEED